MNYYNPYFYTMPTSFATPKVGLFSRLFGNSGITLGGILNGTQKALNFANQAIPLVKQVKPMIGNAKTMFKVMNEFKRVEKPKSQNNNISNINKATNNNTPNDGTKIDIAQNNETIEYNEGPTFFI